MNLNVIATQPKKCKAINIRLKLLIQILYTTSLFFSLDSSYIDAGTFEYFIIIQKSLYLNLLETGSTKAHLTGFRLHNQKCYQL